MFRFPSSPIGNVIYAGKHRDVLGNNVKDLRYYLGTCSSRSEEK